MSDAVRGVAVTVGAPYYDFFAIVFGLPIVLLMGIGPLLAWRRASLRALGASVLWPASFAVAVGAALAAAGAYDNVPGLIGYTFAAFVLAAIVLEFWARYARPQGARPAPAGWARSPAWSPGTGAGTGATSSTRRSSCS